MRATCRSCAGSWRCPDLLQGTQQFLSFVSLEAPDASVFDVPEACASAEVVHVPSVNVAELLMDPASALAANLERIASHSGKVAPPSARILSTHISC